MTTPILQPSLLHGNRSQPAQKVSSLECAKSQPNLQQVRTQNETVPYNSTWPTPKKTLDFEPIRCICKRRKQTCKKRGNLILKFTINVVLTHITEKWEISSDLPVLDWIGGNATFHFSEKEYFYEYPNISLPYKVSLVRKVRAVARRDGSKK